MEIKAIGQIEMLPRDESLQNGSRQVRSRLVIEHEFAYGLRGIQNSQQIQVLIGPAQPPQYALMTLSDCGESKGIFATRNPMRPSGLQVITVRLLELVDNLITVEGPQLKTGSLVYDLMPFSSLLDVYQLRLESQAQLMANPRQDFISSLCAGDRSRLLIKAAEIHGHFCPGVALGVMAAAFGLKELGVECQAFDGIMEDLLAIVEINACFTDGIQAVSGCTLGNNALIFRDLGRTAVTFARRGYPEAVRIKLKPEFKGQVDRLAPEFYPLMEKVIMRRQGSPDDIQRFKEQARTAAFGLIELDFSEILARQWIVPQLPDYAPISPLQLCPQCQENVLAGKMAQQKGVAGQCLECAGQPYYQVDGRGIVRQ